MGTGPLPLLPRRSCWSFPTQTDEPCLTPACYTQQERAATRWAAACWRAPSGACSRTAAAYCLGQKGQKRTLVPPWTTVGNVWRVSTSHALSSAPKRGVVSFPAGACVREATPAAGSRAAPRLMRYRRLPGARCIQPVRLCSSYCNLFISFIIVISPWADGPNCALPV